MQGKNDTHDLVGRSAISRTPATIPANALPPSLRVDSLPQSKGMLSCECVKEADCNVLHSDRRFRARVLSYVITSEK